MRTPLGKVSKRTKTLGVILILFIGLLNFHIPHFLIESKRHFYYASYILELLLLVNVIGAVVAAVGIYKNLRWGWILGILISGISFLLYIAQETVGLPGLPKMVFEPSRIVALFTEILFVFIAFYQL